MQVTRRFPFWQFILKTCRLSDHVKGVYDRGTFSVKIVYKRVRGWTLGWGTLQIKSPCTVPPRIPINITVITSSPIHVPVDSVCGICIFVISLTMGLACMLSSTVLLVSCSLFLSLWSSNCCCPSESLFHSFSEIWSLSPDFGVYMGWKIINSKWQIIIKCVHNF